MARSSAPAVFAARVLLGVHRSDDSGKAYSILPWVGHLIRGRVATRAGEVHVEWDGSSLSVDIPPGLPFTGGLPAEEKGCIAVDGNVITNTHIVRRNGMNYMCVPLTPGRHRLCMFPDAQR